MLGTEVVRRPVREPDPPRPVAEIEEDEINQLEQEFGDRVGRFYNRNRQTGSPVRRMLGQEAGVRIGTETYASFGERVPFDWDRRS